VNARDAMPTGGTLRIATDNAALGPEFIHRHPGAVAGKYVSLTVQDSGSGMAPDVLAHVFEPFFTTKPIGKGTGLGLATVYSIVKQNGGYVAIDSTVGVGTTVSIYLPVAEGAVDIADGQTSAPVARGTETVLLVEDEAGLKHLIRRTLTRYGYTVLESENVNDALDIAEHHEGRIDLLLSDVIMPGLNGPDLAQRIVRLRPEIRVLYVSGFTNSIALGAESLSARASLLQKPFTPQALAAKVRERLDHNPRRGGVR
jgi:two-component system, cell cycle sensor histidine kinase and response regulator CckA